MKYMFMAIMMMTCSVCYSAPNPPSTWIQGMGSWLMPYENPKAPTPKIHVNVEADPNMCDDGYGVMASRWNHDRGSRYTHEICLKGPKGKLRWLPSNWVPGMHLAPSHNCILCTRSSVKHKIFVDGCQVTQIDTVSYWNESGEFMKENPNMAVCVYNCSNGHTWIQKHDF